MSTTTRTYPKRTRLWDGRIQYAGETAANQFGVFTVEGASPRQSRFLARLLATRQLPEGFTVPANVERLSKDSTGALIDLLLDQPELAVQAPTAPVAPSTRKANRYAGRCVRCGGRVEAEAGFLAKDADGKWAADHRGECPTRTEAPAEEGEVTPGVYRVDGQVYIVKPNQAKTRLYAKRLVELGAAQGDRLNDGGEHVRIEFEYAPGAIFQIRPSHRMPLEEGKALTVRYGKCICCSRTLKVAESVERGIGPVCVKYFA